MFDNIKEYIDALNIDIINNDRKVVLQPLIAFLKHKGEENKPIDLNFICTHNSRRSHLSQVWAQVMANYFSIENVTCYSGGTEATALFPKVKKTLVKIGFDIKIISQSNNPIYSIKYADNVHPLIGFSKTYDNSFNPKSNFAAILTCSHADGECPFISGAEKRIPITFNDPKAFDNTDFQDQKYLEKSNEIATEMKYVFQQLKVK
ncbi:low molecular weight phosphatase family protein [Lacinutrix jangbogonensis]|uniref:protein-tyrosine-phosphatase n=1 Tax=Lacinutrix jangbogonensis TaxID=1469557 RepID=UPI00053DFAF7|nr:protein-tyrosine-phosphatase [Lacinutrix jangbogonensis]